MSVSQVYCRSRLKVRHKKADEVGSRTRPCRASTLVPLSISVRANMSRAHAPECVESTFSVWCFAEKWGMQVCANKHAHPTTASIDPCCGETKPTALCPPSSLNLPVPRSSPPPPSTTARITAEVQAGHQKDKVAHHHPYCKRHHQTTETFPPSHRVHVSHQRGRHR